MSLQAINSVNNIQQKPVQSTIEPKKSEQKESIANGTTLLLGSLAALAVGAGIYFATKGRGGKSVTGGTSNNPRTSETPSEIKILKEKIKELRQKVRENYNNKKQKINERVTMSLNSYCRDYLGGGIKFADDYEKLIKYLSGKTDNIEGIEEMSKFIRNYRTKLTTKVRILYQDPDWQLLRKLRRTESDDQDIRAIQHWLVDDLLYSKANGTTSELLKTLGLSVEDAMQMVREPKGAYKKLSVIKEAIIGKHTPEGAKEYSKRYENLTDKRTSYGWNINIKDLFIDLSDDAKKVEVILPKLKRKLEMINNFTKQKKEYISEIKNLRNTSRLSDEVKELKEALARLKELENNK